jgi:hypothetical protein
MSNSQNFVPASEWLTLKEAIAYSKECRAMVYIRCANGDYKWFTRKRYPWSKSGRKLISRTSIDAFLQRQAEAAGALNENGTST